MQRLMERIVIFVMAIILIVWGVYHVTRYTSDSYQTETVFQETISRSLTGKGIAIRDEQILTKTGTGAERFLYDDGTRVGINQPIVEYFSGDVKDRNIQNMRDIEKEISMLEDAQNKNLNNFSSAASISRDIREQLSTLSQMTATGNCSSLQTVREELALLVNRREIAIGKSDDFQSKLGQLREELASLRSSSSMENIQQGTTPVSGYFAKDSDGYETQLSSGKMDNLEISNYLTLISEESDGTTKMSNGRIVTSSKWYFSVSIPTHEIEWVKVGQTAYLNFTHIPQAVPAKVVDIMIENNNPDAVIVFSSDYINEDIINLRVADVTIDFSQFSGLKIDTSYLRFRKNDAGETERGVYVIDNYVVKFKKIDLIYEEPSFVLSRVDYTAARNSEYVKLFDQIVNGNELYENKTVQ